MTTCVRPAARAQRRPARAVPPRDVVRGDAARRREVSAGVERRPAAVVEDRERVDRAFVPLPGVPKRGPARAVPLRDPGRGDAARGGEVPAGVERGPLPSSKTARAADRGVHPASERPSADQLDPFHFATRCRGDAAGRGEAPAGVERGPRAVVEDGEGEDQKRSSRRRRPTSSSRSTSRCRTRRRRPPCGRPHPRRAPAQSRRRIRRASARCHRSLASESRTSCPTPRTAQSPPNRAPTQPARRRRVG